MPREARIVEYGNKWMVVVENDWAETIICTCDYFVHAEYVKKCIDTSGITWTPVGG